MSLFDDYVAWTHGAKIELVDGKLIVGKSLLCSRLLLHQILQGWGLEAAIALAPESLWWQALSVAFDARVDLGTLNPSQLEAWATALPFQPRIIPLTQPWSWKRANLQQDLRMAFFGIDHSFHLGDALGGGVVNRIGQNGFMPECYFHRGHKNQRLYDYYLDGPADLVVEFLSPGFEDYDREVKRGLYQAAGVGEYWLLDADHEAIEFYQWIEGVYQRQYPDEQGRYRVSSIPGLTVLPNQLWMDRDDRPFPPEAQFFEVAVDAPTVAPSCAQGDGIDWQRDRDFSLALDPCSIAFEDYIYWCPEAKFEFVRGRPDIGGREGIRGLTGMLMMTLGLLETVQLFTLQQWMSALLTTREQSQQDGQRRQAWVALAQQAATLLRERYDASRVAVAGDLATAQPLNFWSELIVIVWGLSTSLADPHTPYRDVRNLSQDLEIQLMAIEDCTAPIDQRLLAGPLLEL